MAQMSDRAVLLGIPVCALCEPNVRKLRTGLVLFWSSSSDIAT